MSAAWPLDCCGFFPVFYISVCVCVYLVCVRVYVCVCVCASISDSTAVCEFAASGNSSIKCLAYSAINSSVYVVLGCGRMVICNAEVTSSWSPVRTECPGNGRPIHCIVVRALDSGFAHCFLLCRFLLHDAHASHRVLCQNSRAGLITGVDEWT